MLVDMRIQLSSILISCLFFGLVSGGFSHAAESPSGKIPVTVNADKLDYDRTNDVYVAEGHVKVEQEGMRAEADKIILNNKTGEAFAEGHVFLQEKGDTIRADKLQININTKAGMIYNGDLFMSKDNLHLKGVKIERKSETVFHVENGTFTTCDEGDWYLKADEIDVDMDRYATGRGVSFNMVGLPVFYTPYLLFPVRRQTGLLIPEAGYSSSDGFLFKNSFFWAISDYQDMTFYSDYRARRGIGSAVEYRYNNSRDSGGKLFYNYFYTFNRYREAGVPDTRWLLSYEHHEEIAEDLSIRSDINLVSDFSYFRDLEKKLEVRSLPYLDSNLFYIERWDTSSLYFLGQYSVNLTEASNENTIQKLPELRYNIFEEKLVGPVHVNLGASATNFSRNAGDDVMRADFNPRLSAVFGSSGLNFTIRAGARATYYDRSVVSRGTATVPEVTSSEPTERSFYFAGADLNARFSRIYGTDSESGFGRIRHSIEPTISYSFIPKIEQEGIPQLDAVDIATRQNQVTVSLINRLTAHYKAGSGFRTFDVAVLRLSEDYTLRNVRSEETSIAVSDQNAGIAGAPKARSEVRAELYLKTPRLLTVSATETYNTYDRIFTTSSESVSVNTGTVRFNVTRQSRVEPKTRYLIGGVGTKLGKWDVDAQVWRDIVLKLTTQKELRLHYATQCWGLGISYITKPGETQYLLTLDLKGLGALKF